MVSTNLIVVFISLVLIAIAEFSTISRNSDIKTMAYEQRPPFNIHNLIQFTNLGRFTAIHFVNILVLPLSVLLVIYWAGGVIGGVLTLLITPVFLFLPFFEVNEYDELTKDGSVPDSFLYHFLTSSFLFLITISNLYIMYKFKDVKEISAWATVLVLLLSPILVTKTFTALLQSDFTNQQEAESISSLLGLIR